MPNRYIQPAESQALALFASAALFLLVLGILMYLSAAILGSYKVGLVVGIVAGGLAGAQLFYAGQRIVPLQDVGVGLTLGDPDGSLYANGNQWVTPILKSLVVVPGPRREFTLDMPGERFDTQERIPVLVGLDTPSTIQCRIVNPLNYIAAQEPEHALRSLYLSQVQIFLNQLRFARGLVNEQSLLNDFLELPASDDPYARDAEAIRKAHRIFEERLRKVEFALTKLSGVDIRESVYSDEGVKTIMAQAGVFRKKAALWGFEIVHVFTPNIRQDPRVEDAAIQKQRADDAAAALKTKVDAQKTLAKDMSAETGIDNETALTTVGRINDQVHTQEHVYRIPGFREAVAEAATLVVAALAKNGQSTAPKDESKK